MNLRWLIIIPAIYIGAAIIAGLGWGPWATYSLAHAAVAFTVATVIMVSLRFGRRRTPEATGYEQFVGYPEDNVLGAIPRAEGDAARSDLDDAGFRDHEIFAGRSGQVEMDSAGDAHGTPEKLERTVERLFSDHDDLRRYEEAIRRGKVVVRVRVDSDEKARARAAEVIKRHGGEQVYYFGSLMTQNMDADPDRITATMDDGAPH